MPLPGYDPGNNQAASTLVNAGQNLRQYLYEQQVQKPAVQAQTAATIAQTGFLQGPQTQEAQQRIAAAALQQKMAKLQAAGVTNAFGPEDSPSSLQPKLSLDADLNTFTPISRPGSQATDTSTGAPQPSPGTYPSQAPSTGEMGPGSSSGSPGSSSSPPPTPPLAPNPAGNSGGSSSTAGTPKASLPFSDEDVQKLQNNGITVYPPRQAGETPFSTPPKTGALTGTSTPPTGVQPATPASPASMIVPANRIAAPSGPVDLSEYAGQPFANIDNPAARAEILARGHNHYAKAGFAGARSDADIMGEWNQRQMGAISPIATQPGATWTTADVGGIKFVNPGGIAQLGAAARTENGQSPYLINPVDGSATIDPRFAAAAASTSPKEVAATQDDLNNINQIFSQIKDVRDAVAAHSSIVGNVTGNKVGDTFRWIDAAAANLGMPAASAAPQAASDMVKRFMSKQFLESLSTLHVGRVTDQEVKKINEGLPQAMRSPEAFNDYLDKTLIPMLNDHQKTVMDEFEKQTGTRPTLPTNWRETAPATAPVPGAVQAQSHLPTYTTAAQIKALPKGARYMIPGDSRPYTR